VLAREPEWNGLPPNLHSRIRFLLERCLKKEPKDRYSGISDARVEIGEVLDDPSGMFAQPSVITKPHRKLRLGISWVAAIFILGLIVAGVVGWYLKPSEQPQVAYFSFDLPDGQEFTNRGRTLVAISPDGTKIVYVANQQLYLRKINEISARPIQGTDENPEMPFFSPDSQWIGFGSEDDRQLKKITISGGTPVTLCDSSAPFGATWGDDGRIVFGTSAGIMSVSENGGTAELLIETKDEQVHAPQVLPGGEWVLFTVTDSSGSLRSSEITRWDRAQIVVQSLKTGERMNLVPAGRDARYVVSTGHLVYALENVLYAVRFDIDNLEVVGRGVPIFEGIRRSYYPGLNTGTANYGFSDRGILVYAVGIEPTTQERSLVWTDREGKESPLTTQADYYFDPKISPDGTKVALTIDTAGNQDIWVWDLVRETMMHLTFDEATDNNPIWTPDGQRIVFASNREGVYNVYSKAADGTGEVEQLGSLSGNDVVPSSWSPDGRDLILEADSNILVMSMENNYESTLLFQEQYLEANPQLSPDGRWLAYFSEKSGQLEIYVCPFPDVKSGKWQISISSGQEPRWSPDGREIYYRSGDAIMMASVEIDPTFRIVGSARELFRGVFFFIGPGHSWDISPDGKQFLMMKPQGALAEGFSTEGPPKINIVLNWFEELKQKVPVD
jgi:serine/threonine-protein kinase